MGDRGALWRRPLVWIGFALSCLAIVTFVALFDLERVYASMRQVRVLPALLSTGAFVCAFGMRSVRWYLLLRPLGEVSFGQARDVLMTGYMINNILPARLGELARALALGKVAGVGRRAALTTVGIERLFDGVVLIGLLSLVGSLFEVPEWTGRLGRVAGLAMAGLAGLTVWLAFHHQSLFWLLDRALFFVPRRYRERALGFVERFVDGTRALRSPGLTVGVLLCTLGIWALEVVVYTSMMRGFGIGLPIWAAAVTIVFTNFGIAVPSAPGHVGVWEAACSGALIGLGLNKERALSYALGLHLMMYICVTVVGVALMWRLGLKLREVTGRA